MARDKVIMLRLTKEEHERLEAEAKRNGLALGPWMRMVALAAVRAQAEEKPKKPRK